MSEQSRLILMVGPPGSGKDTYIDNNLSSYTYINQDLQGKEHLNLFLAAVKSGENIVVSRMNFDIKQRERYLKPAKELGYHTELIVLHENHDTCLKRCMERYGHATIDRGDEKTARSALQTFFTKYQRPQEGEADVINFVYPTPAMKLNALWIDLDGTACNTDHRQHFMDGPKKNWQGFFAGMADDSPNEWCRDIINAMKDKNLILYASGRPDNYKKITEEWLIKHKFHGDELFMRPRSDSRKDSIVKEIILDFEVKTRYNIKFAIDDRTQVVEMLRSRGITVLQCAPGNF